MTLLTTSRTRLVVAIGVAFGAAFPGQAQNAPLLGTPGAPSAAAIEAAREAENAATQAVAQPRPVTVARPARSFTLREIRFSPSGYLSPESLGLIQTAFAGRRFRGDDLGVIADAVARLYDAEGILLAQAFVTGFDATTGTVDVELFEARIGAVAVQSELASAEYYRWRLGLEPGDLADTRRIDAGLARIALTDGVAFDARFAPGSARGQTDLALLVSEGRRHGFEATLDNYGSDTRGVARLGLTFRNSSLTGWNDPLVLSLSGGEHSFGFSAAYGRVIHPSGLTVGVTLGADVSETAALPRVRTQARFAELSLSAPIVVEETRRLFLTASVQGFAERSRLSGVTTVDQSGSFVALGASGAWFGPRSSFSWSQSVRFARHDDRVAGVTGISGVTYPGDASFVARLDEATSLSLRAGWQFASGAPAPARLKFSPASPFAVRGYPTGLQSGDGGWYLRAQVEHRVSAERLPRGLSLTPFVFADTGEAFDLVGGARVGQGRLASAGIGASLIWNDRLSLDAFVAKPLRDVPGFSARGKWAAFARLGVRF